MAHTNTNANTERETRDFMSVESFSQLPFIRSAPSPLARDKAGGSAIRLFGKEFGTTKSSVDDSMEGNKLEGSDTAAETNNTRKFECHYCCRNFPTSQALGGHQNAHKRERQQAKRAHLQSTMLHGAMPDPHVYGFMNYSRLGSAPPLPVPYHSWTNTATATATSRIYGSQPHPINGSPMAFWRVPPAQTPPPYRPPPPQLQLPSSITSISASQRQRFGYESKPEMQEHVSLDLHL